MRREKLGVRGKAQEVVAGSVRSGFLPQRLSVLAVTFCFWFGIAQANPYIAKPGEAPLRLRIATCAVTGGFVHLYTALENNLFDKYGFKLEHIYIRGTGPSLAALMADEIQFLYCAAEATIPALASGIDAKIVSEMLGHSTINITLDLYSHVTPTMQREAAGAMEAVFRS